MPSFPLSGVHRLRGWTVHFLARRLGTLARWSRSSTLIFLKIVGIAMGCFYERSQSLVDLLKTFAATGPVRSLERLLTATQDRLGAPSVEAARSTLLWKVAASWACASKYILYFYCCLSVFAF